ncbi:unnamed protein product [Gongylonema pulchrum]|uniref:C-type lectin domain-containing protein n=1 Tax=Gongylonema pulchrum TaxID=637853 RepID=A0A183EID5_9BILA|nr:unnamed protein product [Gongylonema pulchrum]
MVKPISVTFTQNRGADAGPFWIGIRKINGIWQVPAQNNVTASTMGWSTPFGYEPAVNSTWRVGEPDGCCPPDVTCAISNYAGTYNWDDAGCQTVWTGKTGVVCQRYTFQPVF